MGKLNVGSGAFLSHFNVPPLCVCGCGGFEQVEFHFKVKK